MRFITGYVNQCVRGYHDVPWHKRVIMMKMRRLMMVLVFQETVKINVKEATLDLPEY